MTILCNDFVQKIETDRRVCGRGVRMSASHILGCAYDSLRGSEFFSIGNEI